MVSNAGTGNPGEFLKLRSAAASEDAAAQHDGPSGYCSPFRRETRQATPGRRYPHRVDGRGNGVPFMANDGGAKAYVHSLGEALHYEFKPRRVYVTVVPAALTNTPVLAKLSSTRGPC